jgi:hypothetical protein
LLNSFQVGEAVKIDNLRGREWTNAQGETVYFNTIQGWRIAKLQAEAPAAGQAHLCQLLKHLLQLQS